MTALSPAQHKKLVHKMAHQVLRRLAGAGARAVTQDDIEQELWLAWTIARNRFDPQLGVPFTAYFVRGAWQHINRWAQSVEVQIKHVAFSLNDHTTEDENEAGTMIPDERVVPADEQARLKQRRAFAYRRLSREARVMLEMLENPPPALYAQLNALAARADAARARGVKPGAVPTAVTLSMIATVMGLDRMARARVYRELHTLVDRLDAPWKEQVTND
ncbi:hypothetical protein [Azospirillum argentinense]|uniref:sigma factor n=1 Tax=Azospirillum argentinense TaxID=2970906 RepID=UPI0032DF5AC1